MTKKFSYIDSGQRFIACRRHKWDRLFQRSICALCGSPLRTVAHAIEEVACDNCQSTWRCEAVARVLLRTLNYPAGKTLANISTDLSRRGLGISDDWRLSTRLASRFDYVNTYYHRFPRIDISNPPNEVEGLFEFVICSDVLEHTQSRIAPMMGLRRLLRPGGFAVVTVPPTTDELDSELYPNLSTYSVINGRVHWRDASGQDHVDQNPEFHGGDGATLVFRRFSRKQIVIDLRTAGFSYVEPCFHTSLSNSSVSIPLFVVR